MIFFNEDIAEAYRILNLQLDADEETIKKAYRQAAVRYHPDKHGGDKLYEEHFKRVTAAYELLVQYKERMAAQARSPFVSDAILFQKDIRIGVGISLGEAYRGCNKRLGYQRTVFSDGAAVQGLVYADIAIPKKTRSGQILRVPEKGNVKDGSPGDLQVMIQFPSREDNVVLSPNGALHTAIRANWSTALLDNPFRFDLFRGGPSVELSLNGDNPDGHVYELANMGFVAVAPLFVQVFYVVPSKIKKEDRAGLAEILRRYEE